MIEQRTEEWKEIRRGKFTASDIHRLMGVKGLNKTGETYILEKVAEELGAEMPEPVTYAMQYGIDHEPYAKRYYSKAFNCAISEQPFIIADWNEHAGCSPDGLVTEFDSENNVLPATKGIEIKCPLNPVIHIQNFMLKSADDLKDLHPEYYWQIQMCMAVTGINVWDYVSYFPNINEDYKMVALEIKANEKDIELLKMRISAAVEMKIKFMQNLKI